MVKEFLLKSESNKGLKKEIWLIYALFLQTATPITLLNS